MTARLLTIPFSHYCEKARWALDRCGIAYDEIGSLPMFHYLANRRAGARRTVPVLVDGDTMLTDSTEIVAWADAHRPGTLLPAAPSERAEALALEDDLDRQLGPATRRWGYFYLLPRKDLDRVIARGVPRWQVIGLKATRPLAIGLLRRGLKANAAGAERSRQKIEQTFARVDALLADGRRYLVGARFSVADLTFAALAAPVLLPREHPFALPPVEEFPAAARPQIEAWRATAAGQLALRLYAEQRTP